MTTFLIVISVVAGFVATFYVFIKHIYKLELLIKAKDLQEADYFIKKSEIKIKNTETIPVDNPETIQDAIVDKSPEEIRAMFKNQPLS